MFDVILYRTNSEVNRLNKALLNAVTLSGTLRENCSILSPIIQFELQVADIAFYNYAYIPTFGRYYFITNISSDYNNLTSVSMRVDVLMTYSNAIRGHSAVIDRNANKYNLFLDDSAIRKYCTNQVFIRSFPNGFTQNGSFVLVLAGSPDNNS